MDALSLLRRDHREFRKLLAEIAGTSDRAVRTRTRLLADLTTRLTVHETVEEELFYPALLDSEVVRRLVPDDALEHDVVGDLLAELDGLPVSDPHWAAAARRMGAGLIDHIEREERVLFEAARRAFDTTELNALGEEIARRRVAVLNEVGRSARPSDLPSEHRALKETP